MVMVVAGHNPLICLDFLFVDTITITMYNYHHHHKPGIRHGNSNSYEAATCRCGLFR